MCPLVLPGSEGVQKLSHPNVTVLYFSFVKLDGRRETNGVPGVVED